MSYVVTFINEKGGVGKSSVCFNTAWELSKRGKNILLIDLDGQKANISFFTGAYKDDNITMADIFKHNTDINSAIISVKKNLDIIPANISVASLSTMDAKVSKFRSSLNEIHNNYDFIFIDVNPAPGWSHYLSLSVSNFALIVMLPDIASLEGNKAILDTISEIQLTTNSSLQILGFLINKFDSRTTLSKRVIETTENLASSVHSRLFENSIRQSVLLSENILEHEGITDYAPKSLPAFLYSRFATEFLEAVKNSAKRNQTT